MSVSLPTSQSILGHIFRNETGHLQDSEANRNLLLELANDDTARLTMDRYGNDWYGKIQPDGTQLWAQTRNGVIIDGGRNLTPKTAHPTTGLKRP